MTLSLGRLCGIRLDVHASWLVVYAFVTVSIARLAPLDTLPLAVGYAIAAVAGLALFASVVAHEFAHALVARRFGVATRSIALFIFGGVATLESEPPTPLADACVAIAGPAASAVLAAIAFAGMHLAGDVGPPALADALVTMLAYVSVTNAVLAAFNLIPAYPMDGGRVLRALIWRLRGSRDSATRSAALVGMVFAVGFAVVGIGAAVLTHAWQFAWYAVIAIFVARQCVRQFRALRADPIAPAPTLAAEAA